MRTSGDLRDDQERWSVESKCCDELQLKEAEKFTSCGIPYIVTDLLKTDDEAIYNL